MHAEFVASIRRLARSGATFRAAVVLACLAAGCYETTFAGVADGSAGSAADRRLVGADTEPSNWLTHGRTYDEQRYSPLTQINPATIGGLGLAWYRDLNMGRGQEATPLVVDGKLYTSLTWSVVEAFDAATGKPLWTFDPAVPRDTLVKACCDAVSRGVAYWGGKVFVGTLDGRLIALDANSGKLLWSVVTVDQSKSYTITGAPRVVKGKVIIGNAGAELGVRGYVSAYDAETGQMAWRFYTVPGDPAKPVENAALIPAMKTWHGEWWKEGGGGTVWDGIAYDPDLDLLYIGTGNGGPWARALRSPGGGDNLYLSSIVAVRPETGDYVWHYQETPGDDWDYTATQPMILADIPIGGTLRKVIMQAPKNGFFYVLDRQTGQLLSAEKFAPVNWATHIDLKTGRPVENPAARYDDTGTPFGQWPSARGAHSWQPMTFSQATGLVYIPVQETSQVFEVSQNYQPPRMGWKIGVAFYSSAKAALPPSRAYLLAWDPAAQRAVWRAPLAASGGGALSTAGNLVFQGDGHANMVAYRADNGTKLWQASVGGVAMAAPITYAVGGQQYLAVMVGCGGDFADQCRLVTAQGRMPISDRLVVFRLGAAGHLPPASDPIPLMPIAQLPDVRPQSVSQGRQLYAAYCVACHGVNAHGGGLNPDLRYSAIMPTEGFFGVVLNGDLRDGGMASFAKVLDRSQASSIQSYLVSEAKKVGPDSSHRQIR